MKVIIASLIVVCALAAAAFPADTPPPSSATDALLAELGVKLGSVDTLCAEFVEERHISILTEVMTSRGILFFSKPDRIRLEMTQPYKSILLAAGDSVARYEFVDGRWQKLDAGDAAAAAVVTGQIAAWLAGRFSDSTNVFDITAQFGAEDQVVLTPKNAKLAEAISSIALTLTSAHDGVTSVLVTQPDGDFTRMVFSDVRKNIALDAALFDTSLDVPSPGEALSDAKDSSQ